MHSKDYVAHAGDLWCYRVKLVKEGLLLPGQSRNDPGLQQLRERRVEVNTETVSDQGKGLD